MTKKGKVKRNTSRQNKTSWWVHVFFIVFSIICIVPFCLVLTASVSTTADLATYGFRFFPRSLSSITFESYEYLFQDYMTIVNGYSVTIFITVVGTFLSVLFMAMIAYSMSRPQSVFKNFLAFYIFIPTLFSGGIVSSYIINTQYLNLKDSVWVMILPGLINVFHVFMIRTFFKELPDGLCEAAQIDGASEWKIFYRIAMPLSKPVLATVAFLGALGRWNEWYNAMLYINTEEKYPLQYLLQRVMMQLEWYLKNMTQGALISSIRDIPGESVRMALVVVCIGPMMLVLPFFQKYFTKGMTVGSVKG